MGANGECRGPRAVQAKLPVAGRMPCPLHCRRHRPCCPAHAISLSAPFKQCRIFIALRPVDPSIVRPCASLPPDPPTRAAQHRVRLQTYLDGFLMDTRLCLRFRHRALRRGRAGGEQRIGNPRIVVSARVAKVAAALNTEHREKCHTRVARCLVQVAATTVAAGARRLAEQAVSLVRSSAGTPA